MDKLDFVWYLARALAIFSAGVAAVVLYFIKP